MKIIELNEDRMTQADDIFNQAEALAYEEASEQHHGVSGDRIFAISKQIIHNEVQDPAVASAMIDLMSDRIHQLYTVRESTGEFIPKEKSHADQMAGQLLQAARGDKDIAEKMARGFLHNLIQSINAESKFTKMKNVGGGRPEQSHRSRPSHRASREYEKTETPSRPTFSEFA